MTAKPSRKETRRIYEGFASLSLAAKELNQLYEVPRMQAVTFVSQVQNGVVTDILKEIANQKNISHDAVCKAIESYYL